MDCRLKARMKSMVAELAREHAAELAAAGTLVDLEELTCQIGDEVTRLLTEQEVVRRAAEQRDRPAVCPDCQRSCMPHADPEPVLVTGLRGPLEYNQPKYFCDRCRRSFFPSGRAVGTSSARRRDNESLGESGLGGRE